MGRISVNKDTRAPMPWRAMAQPLPTSPVKSGNDGNLASNHDIGSALDTVDRGASRQPYRLSNLDLVTESLTLMAGNQGEVRPS